MPSIYNTTKKDGPAISDPEYLGRQGKYAAADQKFCELMRGRLFSLRATSDAGGMMPRRPEGETGCRSSMG